MIPKLIHFCWIGESDKPIEVIEQIEDWKKLLKDYEIVEWNENNFNIENSCQYVKEAYLNKKWAFVTDYMRLKVLYEYGGIYLDTDVEVLKVFDDLLENRSFICREGKYSLCTAVIGAEKESRWIGEIIQLYDKREAYNLKGQFDTTPNSIYLYEYFMSNYDEFKKYYQSHMFGECMVYSSDYFSPINYNTMKKHMTDNTYTIHHYLGSWKDDKSKLKAIILSIITRIMGEDKRENLRKWIKKRR